MAACSLGAIKPAAAPASTVATMSSLVILFLFWVGRPNSFINALEITVRSQTNGFRTLMRTCIEPIRRTEIFSGFVRPMRFGRRSAKIMNNIVIRRNEHKNDVVSKY